MKKISDTIFTDGKFSIVKIKDIWVLMNDKSAILHKGEKFSDCEKKLIGLKNE